MSKTTDSLTSTCVLCCQGIKIYAVGPCNHHICFKCSTKMRVICNQLYCAVCRTDMPKIIFINKLHPFDGIISHEFPNDRKFGIFFASSRIQEEYRKLLAHQCRICGIKRGADDTFKQLQDHMRKEHGLFPCQLCVGHLKMLSSERKFYARRDLAQHRRCGDSDDKSYRGHPLCEFCDERYFDNDELLRHLRKDHYFCHFCEKDGVTNQYYGEYEDLADHFREDHYLCEEDRCVNEKFLGAFRTEIDLKAHKAKAHSGKMTKMQVRQTRQVDVEFSLPPRPREYHRGRREGAFGAGGGARGRDRNYQERINKATARAIEESLESVRKEEMESEREEKSEQNKKSNPRKSTQDERKAEEVKTASSDIQRETVNPQRETKTVRKRDSKEDKENKNLAQQRPVQNANKDSNIEKKPPDMKDFPSLAEPGKTLQTGGRWSSPLTGGAAEDFPALGNGDGGPGNVPLSVASSFGFYSSLHSNTNAGVKSKSEKAEVGPWKGADGEEQFPTLSSIASILGGTAVPKKIKTKKKKPKADPKEETNIEEKTGIGGTGSVNKNANTVESGNNKGRGSNDQQREEMTTAPETVVTSKKQASNTPVVSTSLPMPSVPSTNTLLMSSSSSVPSVPPTSRPPPGFKPFPIPGTGPAPPPGFRVLPLPKTSADAEFVQLPNFKERNRELVFKIQGFCAGDEELFGQFKQDSGEFRHDMITAGEYYHRCIRTLSEDNVLDIFNELVTLLPDLKKQQELMTVHNDHMAKKAQSRQDSVLKISNTKTGKSGKKMAWKSSSSYKADSSVCPVCSQVVMARDMAEHMNIHEDFPALSSGRAQPKAMGVPAPAWGPTSWGKGK